MQLIWICIAAVLSAATAQVQYESMFGRCLTPNGERSVCVYLQECADLYALITKVPLNNEDKLYLRRSQCGFHNGKVLVCCPSRSAPVSPSTGGYNNVNTNYGGNEGSGGNRGGGGGTLPQPGECGSGNSDRIYGGNRTNIDEYPWMALLEYTKPGNRKGHHCGGVLINERYVVTASHCVNGRGIPKDWTLSGVRLGEWDTSTDQDCEDGDCAPPVQDVPVERAIPHEQYNPSSRGQYNDIALLRLSRPVASSEWIKPICLPLSDNLRTATFEGIPLDVSGWGKTETGYNSNIKLKARIDGVSLQQCNQVYSSQNVMIRDTQICAGGENGIDSCRGDSGGPLMGFHDNKARPYYFLVGVVSFGSTPCGLPGWPGVYTRISAYLDWIQANISP